MHFAPMKMFPPPPPKISIMTFVMVTLASQNFHGEAPYITKKSMNLIKCSYYVFVIVFFFFFFFSFFFFFLFFFFVRGPSSHANSLLEAVLGSCGTNDF